MHCTVLQKQVSERRAQQQLYSNCFRRPIRATQLLVLCSRPPCLARPTHHGHLSLCLGRAPSSSGLSVPLLPDTTYCYTVEVIEGLTSYVLVYTVYRIGALSQKKGRGDWLAAGCCSSCSPAQQTRYTWRSAWTRISRRRVTVLCFLR